MMIIILLELCWCHIGNFVPYFRNYFYSKMHHMYQDDERFKTLSNLIGLCKSGMTEFKSVKIKTYCALWTEYTGGRSGNDLASALFKILHRVIEDNPEISKIITWSDSCVPQNKNSIMSSAILYFLQANPQIESITMKFSIAGHSAVQEIDNIHSQIEKCLRTNEYFSPMGLIRLLQLVNRNNPLIILQMQHKDFKDFSSFGKNMYNFTIVKFAKLKMIQFSKSANIILFSNDYQEISFKEVNIRRIQKSRKTALELSVGDFEVNVIKKNQRYQI